MYEFAETEEGQIIWGKVGELQKQKQKALDEHTALRKEIEEKHDAAIKEMTTIAFEQQAAFILQSRFAGYEHTKTTDLDHLTLLQLIFLVYDIYKYTKKKCDERNFRRTATLSREFPCGETSFGRLDDACFKEKLIDRLVEGACTHCKCVYHCKDLCPELLKRLCIACKKPGHYIEECSNLEAIRQAFIEQQAKLDQVYEPDGVEAKKAKIDFESMV